MKGIGRIWKRDWIILLFLFHSESISWNSVSVFPPFGPILTNCFFLKQEKEWYKHEIELFFPKQKFPYMAWWNCSPLYVKYRLMNAYMNLYLRIYLNVSTWTLKLVNCLSSRCYCEKPISRKEFSNDCFDLICSRKLVAGLP